MVFATLQYQNKKIFLIVLLENSQCLSTFMFQLTPFVFLFLWLLALHLSPSPLHKQGYGAWWCDLKFREQLSELKEGCNCSQGSDFENGSTTNEQISNIMTLRLLNFQQPVYYANTLLSAQETTGLSKQEYVDATKARISKSRSFRDNINLSSTALRNNMKFSK